MAELRHRRLNHSAGNYRLRHEQTELRSDRSEGSKLRASSNEVELDSGRITTSRLYNLCANANVPSNLQYHKKGSGSEWQVLLSTGLYRYVL